MRSSTVRTKIAGGRWNCVPRREDHPKADLAVAVATELVDSIHKLADGLANLSYAFLPGPRFSRIHGEPHQLKLGDRLERTWWVPKELEDMDKRSYRKVVHGDNSSQTITGAHWERFWFGPGEWRPEKVLDARRTINHIYRDTQATLGFGKPLREALGWHWYALTHIFQESLQAAEKVGQGTTVVQMNGMRDQKTQLPNETAMQAMIDVIEDMRARHILVLDQADTIQHLEGASSGWQVLTTLRQEIKSSIYTLILGANLTTSADQGGSYALAQIQENSTESLIQFDRRSLEETLTNDLLGAIWYFNRPNLIETWHLRSNAAFRSHAREARRP